MVLLWDMVKTIGAPPPGFEYVNYWYHLSDLIDSDTRLFTRTDEKHDEIHDPAKCQLF